MINSAERSMAALAERDTLIALQRRRERDEMQARPVNYTATITMSERVDESTTDSQDDSSDSAVANDVIPTPNDRLPSSCSSLN